MCRAFRVRFWVAEAAKAKKVGTEWKNGIAKIKEKELEAREGIVEVEQTAGMSNLGTTKQERKKKVRGMGC